MTAFDLTEVKFVKRVVVGNSDPEQIVSEEKLEQQTEILNKYLTGYPAGKIIGQEKNFYILHIGEHEVVLQYIVYHVGFARKPMDIDN